ncbi:MAG TPA: hypothetical protein VIF32_14195 [Gemmatimonadaceae bacterium]|jgi:hypothetical protein
MRVLPDRISMAWIETLTDVDLLDVEARVHARFTVLERREKRARGDKYQLMRGPADLMEAWDRWSRLLAATRERSLNPRREPANA